VLDAKYNLAEKDPALARLALIVRGADAQQPDLTPESRGLIAIADPERVHEWAGELAADTRVVVYCSYGFNVGCAVTATLRERGFDARFLRGGLSGSYAAGGARSPRQGTSA